MLLKNCVAGSQAKLTNYFTETMHNIHVQYTMDYRATYVYRIGNGIMCAIVPHSKAHETLPRILSARKDLVKGHLSKTFVDLVDELSSNSQRKPGSILF